MNKTLLVFAIAAVLALQFVSAGSYLPSYASYNIDPTCVNCDRPVVKFAPYNSVMPEVVHIQQGLYTDYTPCVSLSSQTQVNIGSSTRYYSFDGMRYYQMPPYSH